MLLAVIGPRWLAAEDDARRLDDPQDWVRLEIEAAMKREVRIIPVLVDGARMPSAGELPPSLRGLARRQAVTLSPESLDTRGLVSVLKTAIAQEGKTAGQAGTPMPGPAQSRIAASCSSPSGNASMLTGQNKAKALGAIIRAAVLATPERVGWLIAEAEAAARSVEDAALRGAALAGVAAAVAAADPGRGRAIARSNRKRPGGRLRCGGGSRRWRRLTPGGARPSPARSRKRPGGRLRWRDALRRWRRPTPGGARPSPARSRNGLPRASALVRVAAVVAAADPEHASRLIIEAEAATRSVEDAASRGAALAEVAAVVAAADPERGEAIARSIEIAASRGAALAGVAAAVAASDPQHSEAIARSIKILYWQWAALGRVAAAVAASDPQHSEAIARSIDNAYSAVGCADGGCRGGGGVQPAAHCRPSPVRSSMRGGHRRWLNSRVCSLSRRTHDLLMPIAVLSAVFALFAALRGKVGGLSRLTGGALDPNNQPPWWLQIR